MVKSSKELRSQFLAFFESKGHKAVASSPLLPKDDPTLLFVNAGMVQFKDVFTGKEKRPYTRAATSQKCVRAGGKHNDLENVGRTARHHTFFEMLGNFSFGDYFKEEACLYAWEFLTKVLGMDPNKLSVTVFGGEGSLPADEEAERIWRDVVGVPAHAISRKGAADNFWAMGDTGPCGPCTEIHFDRSDVKSAFGGDDAEGDKLMEIWNLVFMQFERKADGTLIPLPAPSVDTGMGLERLCTVINGDASNYDTDLLKPFVDKAATLCGKTYTASDAEDDVSMRVIADHCRTTSFLIADGVLPGNEGRGYVLRRIMRRAIRHGSRLGLTQLFFHEVCAEVVTRMGSAYPELKDAAALIQKVVALEEETFRKTLDRGLTLFQESAAHLKRGDKLNGTLVHKLLETYGFPPDLTTILAEEKGLLIDWEQFEAAKSAHEKASSAGGLGLVGLDDIYKELNEKLGATSFIGDRDFSTESKVIALLKDGAQVKTLSVGESGALLLDQTSFYGESGGQVGDAGFLQNANCSVLVQDTKKVSSLIVHLVTVEKGAVKLGDTLKSKIETDRRESIRRHHSVTHLLHAALRDMLGAHVVQKGSLVAPDRLRFDFSHFEPLPPALLASIEDRVNNWIMENAETHAEQMSLDEAKAKGAMALFGEKYGDRVRVVEMGPHSTELCGGTHVHRTGDIGFFKITSEGPLAAGIRRIEAVAGSVAVELARRERDQMRSISQILATSPEQVEGRVQTLLEDLKALRREIETWQSKEAGAKASQKVSDARVVKGIKVVSELLSNTDSKALNDYADKLRDHLGSGIVVLGTKSDDGKCSILVALTKDLTDRYHAGKLVGKLAEIIGGRGGGRPDFAQAGGTKPEALNEALTAIDQML